MGFFSSLFGTPEENAYYEFNWIIEGWEGQRKKYKVTSSINQFILFPMAFDFLQAASGGISKYYSIDNSNDREIFSNRMKKRLGKYFDAEKFNYLMQRPLKAEMPLKQYRKELFVTGLAYHIVLESGLNEQVRLNQFVFHKIIGYIKSLPKDN